MINRRKLLQILSSIPFLGFTKLVKGNSTTTNESITNITTFDKALSPSEIMTLYKVNLIELKSPPRSYSVYYMGKTILHGYHEVKVDGSTYLISMYKSTLYDFIKDVEKCQKASNQKNQKTNVYYYPNKNGTLYGCIIYV